MKKVIREAGVNNGECFIVDNSTFVNNHQLNPGVEVLFEGDDKSCIAFCISQL